VIRVLAVVALTFTFMSHSSADGQLSQMRSQLTAMSGQVQAAEAKQAAEASTYSGLSGKLGNLTSVVGEFPEICTQDLTGSDGPAAFYFLCTDHKP
jgi:hypothetical protein